MPPPSSSAGAAGGLPGTSQLQGVIDKFTGAVTKLDTILSSWGSTPTGLSRNGGGNASSSQQQQPYGTFPPVQNPFTGSGTIKPILSYNNATGTTQPTGAYGFTYAGQAQPGQSFPNGGGSTPGGGGGAFGAPTTLGASASGFFGAVGSFGNKQLPVQAAMGSYVQLGTLAAPNGMSNSTASAILRGQAFGNGSGTMNAIASNAYDAMQGQSLINWASGAFSGRNSLGMAMQGTANMVGYANQGLGYYGSAQLAQTMYSPQMSLRMMQLGYPVTPRAYGGQGGAASGPAFMGGIMQTLYQGRRSVSQQTLNAGLAPGGKLGIDLQALGYNGQNLQNMGASLSAYNKLANAGYSNSTMNSLFAGARNDNQGAINKLSAAGITQSDIQVLKNRTAAQTGTSSNEYEGFTAGLRQSVGLLTQFNKILSTITDSPIGKLFGFAGGIGAGGSLANTGGISSILSSGMGLLSGATRLLGGAAPASSGATSQASPARGNAASGAVSGAASAAVGWAEKELGTPYVWGGQAPGGFDCSGLTMWSYKQAGVSIPRTSQEQWAWLERAGKSVPLNAVQEGDLVFSAGVGDGGTFTSPGHVGMMVSNNALIEAPQTGEDVKIIPYSPSAWQHAGRPSGAGVAGAGPGAPNGSSGSTAMIGGFSSTSEADNVMGALSGGSVGGGMGGAIGGTTNSTNGTSTGSSGTGGATTSGSTAALAKKMAAARGWTGALWNDILYVEGREDSTWSLTAKNPDSPAYGIAQFINGPSEYYQYGGNPNTAAGQITGFYNYMEDRYHGPSGAAAFERAHNSYGQGTRNARRGPAIVGDRGPEVMWMNGGENISPLGKVGPRGSTNSSGCNITLQFGNGAIQISGMGAGSDVSQSAQEIAHSIGTYLSREQVIKDIAAGVS